MNIVDYLYNVDAMSALIEVNSVGYYLALCGAIIIFTKDTKFSNVLQMGSLHMK